jgi:hypothetical protein
MTPATRVDDARVWIQSQSVARLELAMKISWKKSNCGAELSQRAVENALLRESGVNGATESTLHGTVQREDSQDHRSRPTKKKSWGGGSEDAEMHVRVWITGDDESVGHHTRRYCCQSQPSAACARPHRRALDLLE